MPWPPWPLSMIHRIVALASSQPFLSAMSSYSSASLPSGSSLRERNLFFILPHPRWPDQDTYCRFSGLRTKNICQTCSDWKMFPTNRGATPKQLNTRTIRCKSTFDTPVYDPLKARNGTTVALTPSDHLRDNRISSVMQKQLVYFTPSGG